MNIHDLYPTHFDEKTCKLNSYKIWTELLDSKADLRLHVHVTKIEDCCLVRLSWQSGAILIVPAYEFYMCLLSVHRLQSL